MRARLLLVVLLSSACSALEAQVDRRIRLGTRIRVDAVSPAAILIGRVASIEGDTLAIERAGADTTRISLRDVNGLSVYRRGKEAQITGMVFGSLGAVSTGVLYVRWCLDNPGACAALEPEDDDPYDDEEPSSVFATLTLSAAVLGYVIGYALVPPRWEIVDIPFRVGVAPMQRGVGVYVSLPAPRFVR